MSLNESHLESITILEKSLKECLRSCDYGNSIIILKGIQRLFLNDQKNHRLLKARLWGYEIALSANKNAQAAAGLEDLLNVAKKGTKIRLEAQVLLVIACLRQKNRERAKVLVREVFDNLNDIKSDASRQLFHKKVLERLEEECILSELIGKDTSALNLIEIHAKAVLLIQNNSDDEILELMAESLPAKVRESLRVIRGAALLQINRPNDIKAIGPEKDAEKPKAVGARILGVFKRVIWKGVCSPQSSLFKMWNKKLPETFGPNYLTAAVLASMNEWRIGAPMIAVGLSAVVMKASAEVFCEANKPEPFMTHRSEVKRRSSEKMG